MTTAYAILKKATAFANHGGKQLAGRQYELIVQVCDEILGGQHHDSGLARVDRPSDVEAFVRRQVYKPEYKKLI